MEKINIAIDGPAGAGKSTVAKRLAKLLNIIYIDTGAMYRTVALKAIRSGISPGDREGVISLLKDLNIEIVHDGEEQMIYLDGENVSSLIRTPEVSVGASDVAVIREVRLKMVELQRSMASQKSVVMDGRDIGTYVLPDADCKIFLTASVEERARRRYLEQQQKGMTNITYEDVKKDIEYRDKNDSQRDFAPLSVAEDAVVLDTTGLGIDEVVEKILGLVREKKNDTV